MSKLYPQGAQTIAQLRDLLSRLNSPEGIAAAKTFAPRPDDIVIASYPKSGTTWMQQLVHGLKTGGDMAFADITEAVPWIELAHVLDLDIRGDQPVAPRLFKTHWRGDESPGGVKTIVVFREPKAVALSYYHFYAGWVLDPDAISLDEFVADFFIPGTLRGTYWTHLKSWLARADDPQVLLLSYEGLKADLPRGVDRIVAFAGLAVSQADREVAIRQAAKDFMTAHSEKFDEHLVASKRNLAMGVPATRHPRKIQAAAGQGPARALDRSSADRLDQIWADEISTGLGFADYAALRQAFDPD
ncbi:MAG: sulfotransferase domain-containing protein [Rhodospirillaceae bacterium]